MIVETMRALADGTDSGSALPDRVRQVIAARLERLGERSRSLLATASVIGREFGSTRRRRPRRSRRSSAAASCAWSGRASISCTNRSETWCTASSSRRGGRSSTRRSPAPSSSFTPAVWTSTSSDWLTMHSGASCGRRPPCMDGRPATSPRSARPPPRPARASTRRSTPSQRKPLATCENALPLLPGGQVVAGSNPVSPTRNGSLTWGYAFSCDITPVRCHRASIHKHES